MSSDQAESSDGSVEMKAYFHFLSFILQQLNVFNTLFQTDATQIALLMPEMTRLLRLFMAKFIKMRTIKAVDDLTTVSSSDPSQQLDDDTIAVDMKTRTMLVDCAGDFDDATLQRFFASVRKFYVSVVDKMARIFPFNDEALKDLTVLNPDPKLRDSWNPETVRSLASRFSIVAADELDALVVEFQDYQLSAERELPAFNSDTRTNSFWAEMGKVKTFTGERRFPLLGRLMTILSVIAHSNADSERVFSMCRKIDTDARSQLGNDTLRALLSCKINSWTMTHYALCCRVR